MNCFTKPLAFFCATMLFIFTGYNHASGQAFSSTNLSPFNSQFFFSRVIDFDNDGDEDVFGWNGQVANSAKLYENNGAGAFVDVSVNSHFPNGNERLCADLDKNGFMDVYYFQNDTLFFYLNQDGVFQAPSSQCGKIPLSSNFGSTNLRSIKLADINGDGVYDVLTHVLNGSQSIVKVKMGSWSCGSCGFAISTAPAQSLLTLNNAIDPLLGVADVNNDGAFDLLIGNGTQSSPYASGYWNFSYSIYLNNGLGVFSFFSNSGYGLGRSSAFGSLAELNNDGRVDIFSGAADCCVGGTGGGGNINPLYTFLSNSSGTYNSSTTAMSRAADRKYYNSATVVDIDFDGDQDVLWTDIYAYAYSSSALQCYLNNGSGSLTESSAVLGIQLGTSSSAVLHTNQRSTMVDVNNDLKPDLNIQSYGTYNGAFHNNYTMLNNSTNNVVKLKLSACSGLREGYGARIRYKVSGQWKNVQHTAYATANQPFIYLGLGNSNLIDSIEVHWVGGAFSSRVNVAASSFLVIKENDQCGYSNNGLQQVAITDSILVGDSYAFGSQTLTQAGVYTEVFTSAFGCDSTVVLTLTTYEPALTCDVSSSATTVCAGESLSLSVSSNPSGTIVLNYEVGDTGPAGGIVFYDKGFVSDGWRYLEAAPQDIQNSRWGCYDQWLSGTSLAIGSGLNNSQIIASQCSDSSTAAVRCLNYTHNGFDDWYLPSQNEFSLIYQNLILNNIGNFKTVPIPSFGILYWTSSELTPTSGSHCCVYCDGNFYQFG